MATPQLRISPAEASDVSTILGLIRELAAHESSTVTATEHELLRDGFGQEARFRVLLAWVGEVAVGFAFYVFTYSTYRGAPVLFLEDLYVRPEHRRQGIGLALMRALAREAIERGCARFVWEVLDWNAKAISFYASLGAEIHRERLMTWLTGDELRSLARP
jgi:GNAT superfamily N-acetyltransferase